MKKNQWILIAALVVVLALILMVATRLGQPNEDVGELPDNGSTTESTGGETEGTLWLPQDEDLAKLTFEEYSAMTADQQQEFSKKFSSVKAFINWYWEAKEIYDAKQDVIIIGPNGGIDIEDIIGTKPQ